MEKSAKTEEKKETSKKTSKLVQKLKNIFTKEKREGPLYELKMREKERKKKRRKLSWRERLELDNRLYNAVIDNDLNMAKLCLESGGNVNLRTSREVIESNTMEKHLFADGTPLLNIATNFEYAGMVKLLIEYNADVNASDSIGTTALFEAGDYSIAKYLIEHNAEVNAQKMGRGSTPLIKAVWQVNNRICELLVENGAGVNTKNDIYRTALMYASRFNNTWLVEYLLSKGADPTMRDSDGKRAYEYAEMEEIKKILILHEAFWKFGGTNAVLDDIRNCNHGRIKEIFENI